MRKKGWIVCCLLFREGDNWLAEALPIRREKGRVALQSRVGCWVFSAAFVIDRLTKAWAIASLKDKPSIQAIPGVLRFTYVENTGAAFGMFRNHPALLLGIVGVVVAGILAWLLWKGKEQPAFVQAVLWLFVSGAIGNLVDRVLWGHVVDFLAFSFISFPVFNVADCAVSVAFAALTVWILWGKEKTGAE